MENKIKQLCKEKGVTPYRVAKDLGINPSVVYNYIDGDRVPTTERSIKIAKYFGVTVEDVWK